jgi:hypothetical protein
MSESDREMIEGALRVFGYSAREWRDGEEGIEAVLGRFRVLADDEREGVFEGDEGTLTACVVGSAYYGNRRVMFGFTPDGNDGADEVDLDNMDPVD